MLQIQWIMTQSLHHRQFKVSVAMIQVSAAYRITLLLHVDRATTAAYDSWLEEGEFGLTLQSATKVYILLNYYIRHPI